MEDFVTKIQIGKELKKETKAIIKLDIFIIELRKIFRDIDNKI